MNEKRAKRLFHAMLREAKSVTKEQGFWSPERRKEQFQRISRCAHFYRKDVSDKRIWLTDDIQRKALVLKYVTRLSSDYQHRQIEAIESFFEHKATYGLFLTLTVDPNQFSSIDQSLDWSNKQINRIHSALLKRYGRIDCCVVREAQSNSKSIHYHLAIAGLRYIPQGWIASIWERGFVWVERITERFDLAKYVSKYIRKALGGNEPTDTQLLLWATGRRYYTFWHALSLDERKKNNSNQNDKNDKNDNPFQWEYKGCFSQYPLPDAGIWDLDELLSKILPMDSSKGWSTQANTNLWFSDLKVLSKS